MSFLRTRLRSLRQWLSPPKPWLLAILVVVLALFVAFRRGTSEPTIRLVGLAMQLLGILTVIWGISETRALFGHPSFAATFRRWFKAFPFRRSSIVVGVGAATLGVATAKGRGHVTHSAGPDATVEARLDSLEQNIGRLHDRITGLQRETDAEFQRAAEKLTAERDARSAQDQELGFKLEATGTGGVHISAIGAFWLFVGVALSSASVELAGLMK
jgi:hypothetical protein